MKLLTLTSTTLLAARVIAAPAGTGPAPKTAEYLLTCTRSEYLGPTPEDHFAKVFHLVCVTLAHCEDVSGPDFGPQDAMVIGGCAKCPEGVSPNIFGDCLLAPIPKKPPA